MNTNNTLRAVVARNAELQAKFAGLLEDNTAMPYQARQSLAEVMVTFAYVHLSPPLRPVEPANAADIERDNKRMREIEARREKIVTTELKQPYSDAARDVLAERRRQVEQEGWTSDHDDKNNFGEMARAAACYAMHDQLNINGWTAWPWSLAWWKSDDGRGDLVKAGALIIAEIERLDRAAAEMQRKDNAN